MALVNFATFVFLKVLDNLITVDVSEQREIVQRDITFILNILSESSIHFT